MWKNYLTIAVRNLIRQKGYSLINILGLAIGIACCLLILLYVQDELSYDRYNDNADRIYRLTMDVRLPFMESSTARSMPMMGPNLRDEYPEVVDFVRFKPPFLSWMVRYEDNRFNELRFVFADSSIFEVFSLNLVRGNPSTALRDPYTMVINEDTARKYFGDEDPIGKVVNADNWKDFRITGVMENMPENSHIRYDILPSFVSLTDMYGDGFANSPFASEFYTYLLLQEGVSVEALEAKFPDFIAKHYGSFDFIKNPREEIKLRLQPLTDIHLRSNLEQEFTQNNDIATVYTFSIIAVFILIIACINFMNLATARAANRTREIGLRKVLGAYRSQLIRQFLGESIFFALLALVLAVGFVYLSLPAFSALAGKDLALNFSDTDLWIALVGITFLVGVLAGSYPAFMLSAFQPTEVLKGGRQTGARGTLFRKILVVSQFAVSIALIIGTFIVQDQMTFLQNKPLGFKKDQMVILRVTNGLAQYTAVKNAFLEHPNIEAVTMSNNVPGGIEHIAVPRFPLGVPEGVEVNENTDPIETAQLFVGYDFIDTYDIELLEGRNFSREFGTDSFSSVILNQSAAKLFGWESAVDKYINAGRDREGNIRKRQVIAVVKDFHVRSLHEAIEPLAFTVADSIHQITGAMTIRIRPNNVPETMAFIEETWRRIASNWAFHYSFLDEDFARHYHNEEKLRTLSNYFAFLAIFIGCLGLFGLASFTAQKRTKEIGIRKVLGAPVTGLVLLLAREFLKLVLIANVIAWPIIYLVMDRWLSGFAYRIDINWPVFILAGLMALAIALFTVSFQAIKAAWTNPVDTLRYE